MKITFISNYFNHHQKPVSDNLQKKTGGNFTFFETTDIPDERKKLGYTVIPTDYTKKIEKDTKEVTEIINSDFIICGVGCEKLIRKAKRKKKLMFRLSERPLKTKEPFWKLSARYLKYNFIYPRKKPIYLLSCSGFASADYNKFHVFKNKAYKWGYFPETIEYDSIETLIEQKDQHSILWCSRMISLKHPEYFLGLAKKFKQDGIDCKIKVIGNGPLLDKILQTIENNQLNNYIELLGSMSPNDVRKYMEKSEIFIFTSDSREGWGAVLNEAMNSGCAVVANSKIGSVPFLLKNEDNGLIYPDGDFQYFYSKVKQLLQNDILRKKISKNAYKTIVDEWNADVATSRLIELSQHIMEGDKYPDLYTSGPCSKAEILQDNWFIQQNERTLND